MCGSDWCGELLFEDVLLLAPAEDADACPTACKIPYWLARSQSSSNGDENIVFDRERRWEWVDRRGQKLIGKDCD